ncbi:MAG: nicotinamide riboside transporter PnuC [Bacillota bacterium]|nr:nicotinamide riboside transporter PnuC [Bacillota bacterium]
MKIKGWNLFEVLWLTSFTVIMLILSILWKSSFWGISVYITGVLCVVLAAKGNIWNYVFGIYNSIGYALISYHDKLYGEVMLNLLFFVPTGIIGWFMWRNRIEENTVIMRKMKWQKAAGMIIICLIATIIYGLWLSTLKGQNTPYLDAFNVVFSIVATLAMMLRYREQWVLYIIINIAETIMWIIRLVNGSGDALTMTVMWIAYLVNSIYGLYVWNKGSNDAYRDLQSELN